MSWIRKAGLGLLVAGCAISPPRPIYEGLTKLSYGQLTNYRDASTKQSISPPLCDPTERNQDTQRLARDITAALFKPLQDAEKVDPAILAEDLQGYFKVLGDVGGYPVVIIHRDAENITFWYYGGLVYLEEVQKAASKYCSKRRKISAYEGSSRKCSDPKLNIVSVNGNRYRTDTYVISSFRCT